MTKKYTWLYGHSLFVFSFVCYYGESRDSTHYCLCHRPRGLELRKSRGWKMVIIIRFDANKNRRGRHIFMYKKYQFLSETNVLQMYVYVSYIYDDFALTSSIILLCVKVQWNHISVIFLLWWYLHRFDILKSVKANKTNYTINEIKNLYTPLLNLYCSNLNLTRLLSGRWWAYIGPGADAEDSIELWRLPNKRWRCICLYMCFAILCYVLLLWLLLLWNEKKLVPSKQRSESFVLT